MSLLDNWPGKVVLDASSLNFTDLGDTPSSYSGQSGKAVVVKGTEDGLEFGTLAETLTLADLSDVTISSPADNELLAYDSGTSEWINQTPAEAGLDARYVEVAGDTMTGHLSINNQKQIRFFDVDSSNFMALQAPATVTANTVLSLPDGDGGPHSALVTDGAGNLLWKGHNGLGGVQGGQPNQYYHLNQSEHVELNAWLDDVTLSDGGAVDLGTGSFTTSGALSAGAGTLTSLSVSDGNITNVGEISLDSIAADGTAINIEMSDGTSSALDIKEGVNSYMTFNTTDAAENITIAKKLVTTHGTIEAQTSPFIWDVPNNAASAIVQITNSGIAGLELQVETNIEAQNGKVKASTQLECTKWTFGGNMTIDAIGGSDTTLTIQNSGAGSGCDGSIDGDWTVGSALKTSTEGMTVAGANQFVFNVLGSLTSGTYFGVNDIQFRGSNTPYFKFQVLGTGVGDFEMGDGTDKLSFNASTHLLRLTDGTDSIDFDSNDMSIQFSSSSCKGLRIPVGGMAFVADTATLAGVGFFGTPARIAVTSPTGVELWSINDSTGAPTYGSTANNNDIACTFNAATNIGLYTWMEDEDYFKYGDDILMVGAENIYFRDTAISINSATDGHLDLTADISVDVSAPLLLLPVKATTGDPTGQEGGFYVNTFDNTLRLYADGVWRTVLSW